MEDFKGLQFCDYQEYHPKNWNFLKKTWGLWFWAYQEYPFPELELFMEDLGTSVLWLPRISSQ